MRRRARIDANQPAVVEAFRELGCGVWPTHQLGGGFPDLVVCIGRIVLLVEVKDGSKPPSARKLTPDEAAFHSLWPVHIVESSADVEALVSGMRRQAA